MSTIFFIGTSNLVETSLAMRKMSIKNKNTSLLTSIGIKRINELTPRKGLLYTVSKKLAKKISFMKKKNITIKKQLKMAQQFVTHGGCNNLVEKVSKISLDFIKCQVNIQKKKPKGRRYTLEDKILALSIFKTSPKGYKFLASIFALPSRSTLNAILEKIPFKPGINLHIQEHLKHRVSKLKVIDTMCALLFDEMALSPGLKYDKKNDMIFGFNHTDNTDKNKKFSDHVLVFMLRGIVKKWKQPYAYFYCTGTTPTKNVVEYLKNVVKSVNQTGLNIVDTVCDQGGTNVAAINLLIAVTKQNYEGLNMKNKNLGFEIDDKEIIPIYDPPHLLKCIRNNLYKKDVIFTIDTIEYTASWDHIRIMYEYDKINENFELCSLHKLHDKHINIEKTKMKVSFAAQVFSHTVASTMKLLSDHGALFLLT